jgi:hypothetical protein
VRKIKNGIFLTLKGRKAIEQGPSIDLYKDIFIAGMHAWNWGYEDRYPDFDFIQDSGKELLLHLSRWSSNALNATEFFQTVFERLPLRKGEDGEWEEDAHQWALRCFHLRFFRRFCVPFGLLQPLSEVTLLGDLDEPYEKTEFFLSVFLRLQW